MNRNIVRFLFSALLLLSLCFGAYAQETAFIGKWYMLTLDYGDKIVNAADIDHEAMYEFFEDGTVTVTVNGVSGTTTWTLENGAPVVAGNDRSYVFKQNGDNIDLTDSGLLMSFGRQPGAARSNQNPAETFVPSGVITPAQEFDYMGMWRLTSYVYNGVTYTGEAMGTDVAFLFSYYNNVAIITNGESRNSRWGIQDGVIIADTGTPLYHFMPDGEKLVVSEDGYFMTYERDLSASVNTAPWGSAKRLEGKSLLVSLFVTLDGYGWSDGDIASAKEKLRMASEYIRDQGATYGKDLELVYDFEAHPDLRYDMRFEGPFYETPLHDSQRTMEERREADKTYEALNRFIEENVPYPALARKYQTDSIVYVVHVNKHARSSAFPFQVGNNKNHAEMAVVLKDTPAVYAHEILHLFGAVDYYREDEEFYVSAEAVAFAKKNFPADIMVTHYGENAAIPNTLTPLTALGLGWVDDIPQLKLFPELKSNIPGAYTPH